MSQKDSALRIVVLGYVVRGPLGGLTWHHLQYLLGLRRLGHDVYFFEDSDDYESCYDPQTYMVGTDPSYGLRYAGRVFAAFGFAERWVYHDAHTGTWHGPCARRVEELCRSADIVLNLSGVNPLPDGVVEIPRRVLVDTDPVFTQVRHLTQPAHYGRAAQHNAFFTFAGNFGAEGCSVPSDGFSWRPTRQPVSLDAWPVSDGPPDGAFTTVMQWDSYPAPTYDGIRYGVKSDSFTQFMSLPSRVPAALELALGTTDGPRQALSATGWRLRNADEPSRDPWSYRSYIQGSKAEFAVAKQGYVATSSGWFSERSTGYLASARPVVVQETGMSEWLPTGEGVLTFRTLEEAAAGIEDVTRSYTRHCRAARTVVEEFFEAGAVLSPLLEQAMTGA